MTVRVSAFGKTHTALYNEVEGEVLHLICWSLADMEYTEMHTAETMAKLVSGFSIIKTHGYWLKGTVGCKNCILCD